MTQIVLSDVNIEIGNLNIECTCENFVISLALIYIVNLSSTTTKVAVDKGTTEPSDKGCNLKKKFKGKGGQTGV
jgi:hypothetical protein